MIWPPPYVDQQAEIAEVLAALEAQLTTTRELLMRRIAEGWLEGQRMVYQERRVLES